MCMTTIPTNHRKGRRIFKKSTENNINNISNEKMKKKKKKTQEPNKKLTKKIYEVCILQFARALLGKL